MIADQILPIDYSDKVVLITGASRGIGRCLAQSFADNNATVIMTYCHSRESAVDFFFRQRTNLRLVHYINWM